MSRTERYQRLRLLARKLNQQRRRQGRKLDILCNDLLGAQRGFLLRLQDLSFAAAFYRSLLGGTEVNSLLMRAGRAIRQELPGAGVAFFLRQPDGCELHVCPADEALYADRLLVFHNGRILMDDAPARVFARVEELIAIGLEPPLEFVLR